MVRYSAKISSILTIWEKMSTRFPLSRSLVSNLSKRMSFPLLLIKDYNRQRQSPSVPTQNFRSSEDAQIVFEKVGGWKAFAQWSSYSNELKKQQL